ncbi:hypothetical protein ACFQWB_03905 [Paenibacillus thermoaerophilus]|uniref:Uncharacterized protein n=1 Tax=Paenibacillus thermoaerophilus TaxID=1215385 RepID=A0ABW2V2R5_9BACL|nr:hypothetical protein [Paenibacillus thermoaerophilus]TMV16023.1 hypothetical protein FE781_09375 [Paenibacillus thermoaerophilus]
MHDTITLLVSAIEFLSTFIFILIVFRFPIKSYKYHLLFSSLFMSQFSFFLNSYSVTKSIAPLLQAITLILFICFIFRVQIFYAASMGVTGYAVYIIIQLGITTILNFMVSIDQILSNFMLLKVVQLASIAGINILSYFLARKKIGFSFVPDSERQKIKWEKHNILFTIFLIITTFSLAILHYMVNKGTSAMLYICLIVISVLLSIVLYYSVRKEVEQ